MLHPQAVPPDLVWLSRKKVNYANTSKQNFMFERQMGQVIYYMLHQIAELIHGHQLLWQKIESLDKTLHRVALSFSRQCEILMNATEEESFIRLTFLTLCATLGQTSLGTHIEIHFTWNGPQIPDVQGTTQENVIL